MAEALAHNRYYGVPLADAMPRTFVAIEVHLQHVLDFRDGRIRQRLQVSLDRVLTVDWRKEVSAGREPITQMIGRAAALVGLEGLIVPSAVGQTGDNLLLFPVNRRPGSKFRLLRPGRLAP
jgi:RES domain-containing protein